LRIFAGSYFAFIIRELAPCCFAFEKEAALVTGKELA
jgi:hypothetical protein